MYSKWLHFLCQKSTCLYTSPLGMAPIYKNVKEGNDFSSSVFVNKDNFFFQFPGVGQYSKFSFGGGVFFWGGGGNKDFKKQIKDLPYAFLLRLVGQISRGGGGSKPLTSLDTTLSRGRGHLLFLFIFMKSQKRCFPNLAPLQLGTLTLFSL